MGLILGLRAETQLSFGPILQAGGGEHSRPLQARLGRRVRLEVQCPRAHRKCNPAKKLGRFRGRCSRPEIAQPVPRQAGVIVVRILLDDFAV